MFWDDCVQNWAAVVEGAMNIALTFVQSKFRCMAKRRANKEGFTEIQELTQ